MTLAQNVKVAWQTARALASLAGKVIRHGQSFLIYPAAFYPETQADVVSPEVYNLPFEIVQLRCGDGIRVEACMILQDASTKRTAPTVFMFHGNGANYSFQLPIAVHFYRKMRCNVFMLSYRGYGNSQGSPTEKGIRLDAQTALNYILQHEVLSHNKLILYGQSLGGAVAIDLASRNPERVDALIIENTFLSIPQMIPTVIPMLAPFSVFCTQKWNSERSISFIPPSTPMLFLSGLRDEVVPCIHMERLHQIASEKSCSKRFLKTFPSGTHNNTWDRTVYWTNIQEFIDNQIIKLE